MKAAKKAEDETNAANTKTPIARKVKPKKDDTMDDLLSAGLAGSKKGKAKK